MRRLAPIVLLLAGCKGPMAKIDAVRDALVADDQAKIDSATAEYPKCSDAPPVAVAPNQPGPHDKGCLTDIANGLGSKMGFRAPPVDQASAATAAIVIAREGRGDYLVHTDNWLVAVKTLHGAGGDALRLAVARKMAAAAPLVGTNLDDDKKAADALAAISGAIPGACVTYHLLGTGTDPTKIPVELSADHAACVQKDLTRREGMGASYGEGTFRALEGALAVWRETERALRLGVDVSDPAPRAALQSKLTIIEAATQKITTKKVDSVLQKQMVTAISELHAEAGVPIVRTKDGGAPAADAGSGSQSGRDAK